MVEDKTAGGRGEPKFFKYLKKIRWEWKLLIIVSFIFLAILGYATRPIPNLQYINSTNPLARPVIFKGEVPEGYAQVLLYEANDEVPSGGISSGFLVGFFIFVFFLMIIATNKEEEKDFLTDDQARYLIWKRWKFWKQQGLVKGDLHLYHPTPQHHLRTREVHGETKPYEWVIPAMVLDETKIPHYMLFGVNPANHQIYMMVKTTREFSRRDLCPNCGDYHDQRIMDTEEYERFKDLMMTSPKK